MPTSTTPLPDTRLSMRCPQCKAVLRASRKLMGAICACPGCKAKVVVRVPMPSDSEICLAADDRSAARRGSP